MHSTGRCSRSCKSNCSAARCAEEGNRFQAGSRRTTHNVEGQAQLHEATRDVGLTGTVPDHAMLRRPSARLRRVGHPSRPTEVRAASQLEIGGIVKADARSVDIDAIVSPSAASVDHQTERLQLGECRRSQQVSSYDDVQVLTQRAGEPRSAEAVGRAELRSRRGRGPFGVGRSLADDEPRDDH